MKKIILISSLLFLVSCGGKNEENIQDPVLTGAEIVQNETQKLSQANQELLDNFMKEYEAELRATGNFSEEIIVEAVKKIREEKTTELLSN